MGFGGSVVGVLSASGGSDFRILLWPPHIGTLNKFLTHNALQYTIASAPTSRVSALLSLACIRKKVDRRSVALYCIML